MTTSKNIAFAIDPGRCTGYAVLSHSPSGRYNIAYGQEYFDHQELYEFIPKDVDHVICESFEFRQGKQQSGVDLYPCELIGVLHLWYAYEEYAQSLVFQPASVQGKKAFFSDEMLKELKLYQAGVEHGRSAVKHLLQWLHFGPGAKYNLDLYKLILVDEDYAMKGGDNVNG